MSEVTATREQLGPLLVDKEQARPVEAHGHDKLHEHKIVVIVPVYNEERFIGSVVLKAKEYANVVLVVDDGSTDALL